MGNKVSAIKENNSKVRSLFILELITNANRMQPSRFICYT